MQFQNTENENILTSPSAKTMTAGMAGMAKLAAKSPQSSAITSRTLRLDFLLGPSLPASSISFSSLATSLQAPALSGYDEYHGGNTMYCMWRTGRDFDQRREPRKKLTSPIGAEVGKDNHSLWSSSKLIVEIIAVSDVVNHLFVCKARNQLVWQNCLGIATTPEKCKEYYKLHCVPMFS